MEAVFQAVHQREERTADRTVLLSSHILSEVEALCDRVSIIRAGAGGRDRHARRAAPPDPHRRSTPSWPASPNGLASLPGVHDLVVEGNRVRFEVDTAAARRGAAAADHGRGREPDRQPPTLEELFLRHYGEPNRCGGR